MSIKVFFVTAILTSCTMVQMIAQVSIGKSSNIFANYELADKFQDFTVLRQIWW